MVNEESLAHIVKQVREIVLCDKKDRIEFIFKDQWINYPAASNIRSAVKVIVEMPRKMQSQCALVTALPGMGKSSLLRRIEHDLSCSNKDSTLRLKHISLSICPDPTLRKVEESISEALGVRVGQSRGEIISTSMRRIVEMRGIKAILIDEVHNLLHAGRVEQRKNLALLRGISGPPLSLSIIAFGTMDAQHALASDQQLVRRFQNYEISRWREGEEFRSFLAGYESILPLARPSELWKEEKVKYILRVSDGITDEIVKRLTRGAVWSLVEGKEYIDLESLEKAADIPPALE